MIFKTTQVKKLERGKQKQRKGNTNRKEKSSTKISEQPH